METPVYYHKYRDDYKSSITIYKIFNGMYMISLVYKSINNTHIDVTSPYKILHKDTTYISNNDEKEILIEMTVETPMDILPEKMFKIVDNKSY